jgi:murein L,D-transpeptidase YcbB/YkuD
MQNLKSTLVLIIILLALALVGFWAFRTLEPGNLSSAKQKLAQLEQENAALTQQVQSLQNQVATLTQPEPAPTAQAQPAAPAPTNQYQTLVNALQKLLTAKVTIKQGSQGTQVGTLQSFLNIYNSANNKIDNDFGASTKQAIIAFQKDQNLPTTGMVASATLQKMIAWLENQ